MIAVHFYKEAACPYSVALFERVAASAARHEAKIRGTVEIVAVSEAKIKTLNKLHRGKNVSTDVLSFPWEDMVQDGRMLGQLYFCYPYIARQAKRFKVPVQEECVRMVAHGLLHLVGHDHVHKAEATKMFTLQEKIVSDILET